MTSTVSAERRTTEVAFDAYMGAWQQRDPDAIAALHSEDGVLHTHAGPPPAVGRAAIRQAAADLFAQHGDYQAQPARRHLGSDHWVLEWTMQVHGTSVDCVDVVALSADGLVARKDVYFDVVQASSALARA